MMTFLSGTHVSQSYLGINIWCFGADLQAKEQKDAEEHLKELHQLGVDMTKYMVSQQSAPVNEEVQFVAQDRKES